MKSRKNDSESGFTLIEVIITLVVVAVVAAMMTAYFGTSITQSSLPIFRLNAAGKINEILEKISAQYGQYPHWRPDTAYAVGTKILPTKRTGLLYKAENAGTSCSSPCPEPTWPITENTTTLIDGGVTWKTVWVSGTNGAAPTLAPLANQAWQSGKAYSVNSIVVNGGNQYVTTTGGTSGATPPTWGTTSGWTYTEPPVPPATVGVTWKYSGPAPTDILQTLIGEEVTGGQDYTRTFGDVSIPSNTVSLSYRVIQNRFIKFDPTSNQEVNINTTPSDSQYGRYLKVTIALPLAAANRTDETLTTLFVLR
jgi:prepilin-type N-terminal cleavage/methylation domain-containing protein